ncbi:MAG: enoyl-CoA hydratase/isomerase family protein [Anaerolineales bacterium]|jgi:enoyl-CoA hydratase/carnithine racemase
MSDLVLLEIEEGLATLTLNRAQRHNSLVPALLEALLEGLDSIRVRSDLRTVVLQANGRSFSTGGDLRGFAAHLDDIEAYASELVGLLNQAILGIIRLSQPVVGAVHGVVTGGSLGLVLACDIVLLTPEAQFTPYYSVVGFSPDGGWTALLPQIIGFKRAAEVLMRNQTITAEQAVAWGLASRIVPLQELRAAARQAAKDIAAQVPGSVRGAKRLLSIGLGDLEGRLETERSRFVKLIAQPETQRDMLTFLNKVRKGA